MRVVIIVASSIAIVVIGITIWLQTQQQSAPASAGAVEAPRQFDTMGGQEIRPRWDNSGGQSHDTTGN